jgi:hypothetical protein
LDRFSDYTGRYSLALNAEFRISFLPVAFKRICLLARMDKLRGRGGGDGGGGDNIMLEGISYFPEEFTPSVLKLLLLYSEIGNFCLNSTCH